MRFNGRISKGGLPMGKDTSTEDFDLLAERHGIPHEYRDLQGEVRPVPEATRRRMLEALAVLDKTDGSFDVRPPRLELDGRTACYLPAFLDTSPAWGVSLQLYELRSARNMGIGDFADLREVCEVAAYAGKPFADPIRTNRYIA